MLALVRDGLLRFLRVPPPPDPPPGSPASVTAFRASPRYLRYHLVSWGIRQSFALVGLVVFFVLQSGFLPDDDFFVVLDWIEVFAFGAFFVQLVWSYFLIRLDWEQRWYLVTDTALRIREGVFRVREQTMTVANIQNMKVSQGPIQRLFRISDLEVQTAGGGATGEESGKKGVGNNLHLGTLKGLDDAREVRDRIRASVGRHRDSGLGDPDEVEVTEPRRSTPLAPAGDPAAARAARELAEELRRLRTLVETAPIG